MTGEVFITSDLHIGHNVKFIYGPRGFSSIEEMNEAIIERWNKIIQPRDTVILLGDVMLGDNEKSIEYVKQLNGSINFYAGDHDSEKRIEMLNALDNWTYQGVAGGAKIYGYNFYFSHFPTITSSLNNDASLEKILINVHGHTHSKQKFFYDVPYMYNAALDAHNCTPVFLDDMLDDIEKQINDCKSLL